jgi:recombination associated protein RdgC
MWFKQAQIFAFKSTKTLDANELIQDLDSLAFRACIPGLASTYGWTSPLSEEGAPLVYSVNDFLLVCLQFEDKVLPASVIRQEVAEKIKEIETKEERKVSALQKQAIKEQVTLNLLPRAFSKLSRTYAFIDLKNNWLIIDTTSSSKIETFVEFFKRSVLGTELTAIEIKKIAPELTKWLINNQVPQPFIADKSCVLRDPAQQTKVVRCTNQDLFIGGIQTLLRDGNQVTEVSLNWHEHVTFTIVDNFTLKSIKYHDEVLELAKENYDESEYQCFVSDFIIMSSTLRDVFTDLLKMFAAKHN